MPSAPFPTPRVTPVRSLHGSWPERVCSHRFELQGCPYCHLCVTRPGGADLRRSQATYSDLTGTHGGPGGAGHKGHSRKDAERVAGGNVSVHRHSAWSQGRKSPICKTPPKQALGTHLCAWFPRATAHPLLWKPHRSRAC